MADPRDPTENTTAAASAGNAGEPAAESGHPRDAAPPDPSPTLPRGFDRPSGEVTVGGLSLRRYARHQGDEWRLTVGGASHVVDPEDVVELGNLARLVFAPPAADQRPLTVADVRGWGPDPTLGRASPPTRTVDDALTASDNFCHGHRCAGTCSTCAVERDVALLAAEVRRLRAEVERYTPHAPARKDCLKCCGTGEAIVSVTMCGEDSTRPARAAVLKEPCPECPAARDPQPDLRDAPP